MKAECFAGRRLGTTVETMFERPCRLIALSRPHAATVAAAVLALMLTAGAAWPQAAAPPSAPPASPGVQAPVQPAAPDRPVLPQGEPAASPPPSGPQENPGLLNEMGKLLEKSISVLPTLKNPGETIDDLNARAKDAARDATDTLSRLAKPSVVTGRMTCPIATNGAPDCKTGADRLCQAKGFKAGKSLDTDASEKCAGKVYLPGHQREPGDCRTDNYVTRALCQ
jgi:hypothetical protein